MRNVCGESGRCVVITITPLPANPLHVPIGFNRVSMSDRGMQMWNLDRTAIEDLIGLPETGMGFQARPRRRFGGKTPYASPCIQLLSRHRSVKNRS